MAKTLVEKVTSPAPDVSIFKISGVLGYHENTVIEKFFGECGKKNIRRLVIDFSGLGSLGGGCARIIREAAASGRILICIVGASPTVRNFLEKKGKTHIIYVDDHETAIEQVTSASIPEDTDVSGEAEPEASEEADAADAQEDHGDDVEVEVLEINREPMVAPKKEKAPSKPAGEKADKESSRPTTVDGGQVIDDETPSEPMSSPNRELERRIVQYRALFSVNAEFNRIHEKNRLLDAFLLTAIAQVGVESAAFLEFRLNAFITTAWKGFETADPESLRIKRDDVDLDIWFNDPKIMPVDEAPLAESTKEKVNDWGFPFVAPFIVYDEFRGLVLLGKPIRKKLDADASDYLTLLIKQAAIAYENSCRYEEESQRTLGLVHSLISMIEENTARGNTELLVNYVYAVAKAMHYPEEHVQDLLYGTVLRDIGMIKVSDLIVRKPSELGDEEWDTIRRHPQEGAEMLRRMKFSEHTVKVVACHHEHFNGEGYPRKLQGPQIPLGARIVSVVESYAAMPQERPTRSALSEEEALAALKENWGIRYDPDVVAVFVEVVEDEIRTGDKVRYPGVDLFKG
jgi:HD-GYP domain-containing protein (c-di-GMP phosphodiesterase class II)/anti-anti-sigma regulatory factor